MSQVSKIEDAVHVDELRNKFLSVVNNTVPAARKDWRGHPDSYFYDNDSASADDYESDSFFSTIAFDNMLINVMQQPEFSRLDKIPQLGFTEYDTPARHTRWEHSVGTFALCRKMLYSSHLNHGMSRDRASVFSVDEEAAQIASLLHDIGHAFPGHAFEMAMKKMFPDNFKSHEKWGFEIVKSSGIYEALNAYKPGFADRVLKIMREDNLENDALQQLVSGQINADTTDFTVRDDRELHRVKASKTRDVEHAIVRVIESMRSEMIDGKPHWSVDEREKPNVEALLKRRADMFVSHYFVGANKACDDHLPLLFKAIEVALKNNELFKKYASQHDIPYVQFIASGGTDLDSYLNLTRESFQRDIKALTKSPDGAVARIARSFDDPEHGFLSVPLVQEIAAQMPDPELWEIAKNTVENNGGILSRIEYPVFRSKHPDIHIRSSEDADVHLRPFKKESSAWVSRDKCYNVSAIFIVDPSNPQAAIDKKPVIEKLKRLRMIMSPDTIWKVKEKASMVCPKHIKGISR